VTNQRKKAYVLAAEQSDLAIALPSSFRGRLFLTTGEPKSEPLRLNFDRRLLLQFRFGDHLDGGLLAYRELDDVFALTATGGDRLAEARTGKNRQHLLVGLLRQSVFGRLAGYEDVTTPSGCATIRQCAGWLATGRLREPAARPARWGARD